MDLSSLWNFADPEASEAAFRRALAGAQGEDRLVLATQIARTWGLRRDFDRARAELEAWKDERDRRPGEGSVRWWLEWGRSWVSATHSPEALTDDARQRALEAFERAFEAAEGAGLGALAVDALHMAALVPPRAEDQIPLHHRALTWALASPQPAARAWEASLRNNLGLALHQAGRLNEALEEFHRAQALRAIEGGEPERIARWMIGWTLRTLGRLDEALAVMEALERDGDAAGAPDPYVFEELVTLYRALDRAGDAERVTRRLEA